MQNSRNQVFERRSRTVCSWSAPVTIQTEKEKSQNQLGNCFLEKTLTTRYQITNCKTKTKKYKKPSRLV